MEPKKCQTCAIRHRAICGALHADALTSLNSIARDKTVRAGEVILSPLDDSPPLANIVSGVVKLTTGLSDGRSQIVGLQFASDFLGRPFKKTCSYVAEAVTDVTLCSYQRSEFEAISLSHPDLQDNLLKHTLDELDAAREWMLLLGRKSAREKIASFLLLVGRRNSDEGCGTTTNMNFASLTLPLTRSDIADFLGLTTETVSRQLSRLKNEDLIRLEGGRTVIIPDLERMTFVSSGQ